MSNVEIIKLPPEEWRRYNESLYHRAIYFGLYFNEH
jgi:hypothetical protein